MADLEKTGKNLEGRGFRVHRFASGAEAAEFLVQTLHGTSIGIGGPGKRSAISTAAA